MNEQEFDTFYLEKFRKGHQNDFEAVFGSLYRPVCEMASKVTRSTAEAEDICSEAFIKLFEARERFENFQYIKAFLYLTVRNLSLNYLRNSQLQHKRQKEMICLAEPGDDVQTLEAEIIHNENIKTDLRRDRKSTLKGFRHTPLPFDERRQMIACLS